MNDDIFPQERRPRRRRKTPMEIFKEAYLPYLILLLAGIIMLSFILGALDRNSEKNDGPVTQAWEVIEC